MRLVLGKRLLNDMNYKDFALHCIYEGICNRVSVDSIVHLTCLLLVLQKTFLFKVSSEFHKESFKQIDSEYEMNICRFYWMFLSSVIF